MNTINKIFNTTVLVRTDDALSGKIDSETVLLHIKNSKYYGMDSTATRIWELLEQPREVNAIVQELLNEYEATYEQCIHDVMIFLNELLTEKLIKITNA